MAIIFFANYKIIDILKNKTKQTEIFGDHDWATLRTDSQLLVGYFLRRQLGFKRQRCSAVGDTLCFVPPSTRNQQLHFTRVFTKWAGWDLLFSLGSTAQNWTHEMQHEILRLTAASYFRFRGCTEAWHTKIFLLLSFLRSNHPWKNFSKMRRPKWP